LKKTVIAVALAAATFGAFAGEFVTATYNPSIKDKNSGNIVADAAGLTVGTDVFKFVTIDGKFDATRARGTGNLTNHVQARGTFTLPIGQNLAVWGRGGVGRSYTAGNDYGFYTYAGGADLKLYDNVTLFADAERNNSFKAGHPHSTTYELGLGYSLTKKDTLKAAYQRTLGDVNTAGFQLGYNRSF